MSVKSRVYCMWIPFEGWPLLASSVVVPDTTWRQDITYYLLVSWNHLRHGHYLKYMSFLPDYNSSPVCYFSPAYYQTFTVSLFIEKWKRLKSIICAVCLYVYCTASIRERERERERGKLRKTSRHGIYSVLAISDIGYWNCFMTEDYWLFSKTQ
jgi:hypothetical protein